MNNKQIIQQSKSNSKGKAIVSLILGIISIVASGIWFLPSSLWGDLFGYSGRLESYFTIFIITSVAGLGFGIIGLKSTKKLAILGIIFSLASLIILVGFLLIGISIIRGM